MFADYRLSALNDAINEKRTKKGSLKFLREQINAGKMIIDSEKEFKGKDKKDKKYIGKKVKVINKWPVFIIKNQSLDNGHLSFELKPDNDSQKKGATVCFAPAGMKRLDGSSTASASSFEPIRQSRLSLLRRAPPHEGHSV